MKRCLVGVLVVLAAASGCGEPDVPVEEVTGTWGGADAGLIATDSAIHVHIGCTLGDLLPPLRPDAAGNFTATGTYNVNAYPVDQGILHPARFSGHTRGATLILTVELLDTARVLGPVTLTYGREPEMGPCPICRAPMRVRQR